MRIRKTVVGLVAATALAAGAAATPVAAAQTPEDAFRQSAEPIARTSWDAFYSLYDNPVTAPSALGSSLAIMAFGFFVYCPIAQWLGVEEPNSGTCTI